MTEPLKAMRSSDGGDRWRGGAALATLLGAAVWCGACATVAPPAKDRAATAAGAVAATGAAAPPRVAGEVAGVVAGRTAGGVVGGTAGGVAKEGGCGGPVTLGLEAVDASREIKRRQGIAAGVHGALIVEVLPDGPAARAGLAVGDVVEELDAGTGTQPVNGFSDLQALTDAAPCDTKVVLTLRRGEIPPASRTLQPVAAAAFYGAACQQGNASGCRRQADLMTGGEAGAADNPPAQALYERACKLGSGGACRELARSWDEVPARAAERRRLLEQACELGFPSGCVDLAAELWEGGDDVAPDTERAARLFRQACDLGEPAGCFNAGLAYQTGEGVTADPALAAAAFDDACQGGSSEGCVDLAEMLQADDHAAAMAVLNEEGAGNTDGPQEADEWAAALYQRACGGSSWSRGIAAACLELGKRLRDGRGIREDQLVAARFFDGLCALSGPAADDPETRAAVASGCSLAAAQYAHGLGVAEDWGRALTLSKKGCDGGDAFGCFNLGAVYLTGDHAPRDEVAALGYFSRACLAGDPEGCFETGLLHVQGRGARRSSRDAAEFYRQACEAGLGKGCLNLGGLYAGGCGTCGGAGADSDEPAETALARDLGQALTWFGRGCDLGEALACFDLANHYLDGTGVAPDAAGAARLYGQACDGGYQPACAKAAEAREAAGNAPGSPPR